MNPSQQGSKADRPLRTRPLALAVAVTMLCVVLLSGAYVSWQHQARTQLQHTVLKEASQLRAQMESVLNANLHLTTGLAAFVTTHPDLDQQAFATFAERLLVSGKHVVNNFTYAPDHVIRNVYPVEGNEAAIGLVLSTHPAFASTVDLLNRTGNPVLAGPHRLVQGGEGLIAREPLFRVDPETGRRHVWGQVSMPMNMDLFYHQAGVHDFARTFELSIRGRDGRGANGAVFYGDPALFDADPALLEITLPGGTWQLGVRPPAGWAPAIPAAAVLATVLGLLAIFLITHRLAHQALLLRESELRTRRTSERLTALLSAMPNLVLVVDEHGTYREVFGDLHSGSFPEFVADLSGKRIDQIFRPEKTRELWRHVDAALREGKVQHFEHALTHDDFCTADPHSPGTTHWFSATVIPLQESEDGVRTTLWVVDNITRTRQAVQALHASHNRYRELTDAVQQVIFETDRLGRITYINPAWNDLSIHRGEAMMGRLWSDLLHHDDRANLAQDFENLMQERLPKLQHDARVSGSRIDKFWINAQLIPRTDDDKRVIGSIGTLLDITERKHSEAAIRHQALHDSLTGLPNRMLLIERLDHALNVNRRLGKILALLYIDLDNFKPVNDQYGHNAGDQVLCEVARRLRTQIRDSDTAARIGGDEFVVLIESTEEVDGIHVVADKLLSALSEPITIKVGARETTCRVGASIGLTLAPREGADVDTLLQQADRALYAAKAAGKGCIAPGSGTH